MKVHCFAIFSELLVKRLVPLGFTKSDIRKELYGSEDAAALKLLAHPGQRESVSSYEEIGEGSDGQHEERKEGEVGGEGTGGNKAFSIQSIQVRDRRHIALALSIPIPWAS